ncbi:MAG: DUF5993 family protein [Phycisphaerales bacterium]|nr:DUF5993 family protein [Phycisphaerales bacterium]
MIAAGIFILLFLLLASMLKRRAWISVILFFISMALTILLFLHHATETLDLNF